MEHNKSVSNMVVAITNDHCELKTKKGKNNGNDVETQEIILNPNFKNVIK